MVYSYSRLEPHLIDHWSIHIALIYICIYLYICKKCIKDCNFGEIWAWSIHIAGSIFVLIKYVNYFCNLCILYNLFELFID